MQANLGSTESGQNFSVSRLHRVLWAFSDDQQTQNSSSGLFPNANLVVSGGTFVSLSHSLRNHLIIIVHRLTPRTIMSIITLLVPVKNK